MVLYLGTGLADSGFTCIFGIKVKIKNIFGFIFYLTSFNKEACILC